MVIEGNQKVRAQLCSASGHLSIEQQLQSGYNVLKINKGVTGIYLLHLTYVDGTRKKFKILIE
ncbi:MAG: T9SS type A sorting domain-containing protein [Ginsengibacter sp.]